MRRHVPGGAAALAHRRSQGAAPPRRPHVHLGRAHPGAAPLPVLPLAAVGCTPVKYRRLLQCSARRSCPPMDGRARHGRQCCIMFPILALLILTSSSDRVRCRGWPTWSQRRAWLSCPWGSALSRLQGRAGLSVECRVSTTFRGLVGKPYPTASRQRVEVQEEWRGSLLCCLLAA